MEVRDAVENDAGALAEVADAPVDVMCNLVHDRSVRVAIEDDADAGPNADAEEVGESILGFVSFDARPDAVHVTQIGGTAEACERLLEEPLSFARREEMPVELLIPEGKDELREAAETVGFQHEGAGPRFEGRSTTRYLLEP